MESQDQRIGVGTNILIRREQMARIGRGRDQRDPVTEVRRLNAASQKPKSGEGEKGRDLTFGLHIV